MIPGEAGRVVGIDSAGRHGWVGVLLDSNGFVAAHLGSLEEIIEWAEPVEVVTVDIPIGLARAGDVRRADATARRIVGPRSSSVFPAPPAECLTAYSFEEVNESLSGMGAPKLSRQTWALLPKIREAAEVAASDDRVVEVHPEVSFRKLAGIPLRWSKRSWNGLLVRRGLLVSSGIVVPDLIEEVRDVVADDVVDAAVAAWSARRLAHGLARSLPDPPEVIDSRQVAIWY